MTNTLQLKKWKDDKSTEEPLILHITIVSRSKMRSLHNCLRYKTLKDSDLSLKIQATAAQFIESDYREDGRGGYRWYRRECPSSKHTREGWECVNANSIESNHSADRRGGYLQYRQWFGVRDNESKVTRAWNHFGTDDHIMVEDTLFPWFAKI